MHLRLMVQSPLRTLACDKPVPQTLKTAIKHKNRREIVAITAKRSIL